jgi:hypothetical protein
MNELYKYEFIKIRNDLYWVELRKIIEQMLLENKDFEKYPKNFIALLTLYTTNRERYIINTIRLHFKNDYKTVIFGLKKYISEELLEDYDYYCYLLKNDYETVYNSNLMLNEFKNTIEEIAENIDSLNCIPKSFNELIKYKNSLKNFVVITFIKRRFKNNLKDAINMLDIPEPIIESYLNIINGNSRKRKKKGEIYYYV